jgi:hypothetical protein
MVFLGKYTYTTICAGENAIAFLCSLFYLGEIELPFDTVLSKRYSYSTIFFYTPSSMVWPGRILLFYSIATLDNTYMIHHPLPLLVEENTTALSTVHDVPAPDTVARL